MYMMSDIIYDQEIEIDVLKEKIGNIDDDWLQKSKNDKKIKIDDDI
jgi:hypothetical protein